LASARPVLAAGMAALVLTGCGAQESDTPTEAQRKNAPPTLADRRDSARRAAWSWLDQLSVDPVALIAAGENGKKRLGEILSAYLHLLRDTDDPTEQKLLSERIRELALLTARPEYHNMLHCDEAEFVRTSMSYLRVVWLLEQLEQDTTSYRAELESIRSRLSSFLARRSPSALAQFKWYYAYFGWPLPETIQETDADEGIVARRMPVGGYRISSSYALTHEISIAFRTGLRPEMGHESNLQPNDQPNAFDPQDLAYLRRVLPQLTMRFSAPRRPNLDLVAELLSAMAHLDLRDIPAYQAGIIFLLDKQNPNGSWGSYESQRSRLRVDIATKLYLHTTMVALRALLESGDSSQSAASG
jgi:hypothetical protein